MLDGLTHPRAMRYLSVCSGIEAATQAWHPLGWVQVDLAYLKAAIAASPRHMTWLVTTHGSARSDKAFSSWFSGAAAAAGIEGGKSAHGLRKARAMTLAEAGATVHQIAAWTGHESLSEVQRYSKAADRRRILSSTQPEQILETATIHVGSHSVSN